MQRPTIFAVVDSGTLLRLHDPCRQTWPFLSSQAPDSSSIATSQTRSVNRWRSAASDARLAIGYAPVTDFRELRPEVDATAY